MKMQPVWIAAAQSAQQQWRVPASVSLAQFGQESGWGQHMPLGSNNPFGVKAFHGNAVESETTEVVGGQVVHEQQPFARFADLTAAFMAHAELIATDRRYAAAMTALPDVSAFVQHMAPVYATDPNYAAELLAIITGDALTQFDV